MKISKLMIGFALLAIGLIIGVGAWNLVLSYPGSSFTFIEYVEPRNRILFPDSFALYKVPDYLLRYLIIGVFISTVGLTILSSLVWKRLTPSEIYEN